MNVNDELADVNLRIAKAKAALGPLLQEKKRLLSEKQKAEGCTCGTVIMDNDAHRLVNHYCRVHQPQQEATNGN